MDPSRVGELLRVAQVQSLRTLTQTVVAAPMSSDSRQQSTLSQAPAPAGYLPSGRAAVDASPETTVELSAAALLPPVLGEAAIEAIRDTSARPLATVLVDLTRSLHDPSAAAGERPAPALKLATQLRMLTEVIATAADEPVQSPISTSIPTLRARSAYQRMQAAPPTSGDDDERVVDMGSPNAPALDPRITQVLVSPQAPPGSMPGNPSGAGALPHGAAAYLAASGMTPTFARMDLIEVEPDDGRDRGERPPTLLATLHLQLAEFGQVTATVALTGQRAAVSIAGHPDAIGALRATEASARDAAAAWGVKLTSIHFVEFA